MTTYVRYLRRFDTRNRRKLRTAYNPELAHHTIHRTTPAPDPHQSTLRPLCHLYSAGLPPQCLVELQFRDRLCIDTRIMQKSTMPGFVACAAAANSGEIRRLAAHSRLPHQQPPRCAKPAPDPISVRSRLRFDSYIMVLQLFLLLRHLMLEAS